MTCVHDTAFAVETSPTVFGPGALEEVGDHAASFELTRVALFTDEDLSRTEHVETVKRSLDAAGVDTVVYSWNRIFAPSSRTTTVPPRRSPPLRS